MDDLKLQSPEPLRPLLPLLSSVAENAPTLTASEKHPHHHHHNSPEQQQQLDVDIEARSLQPLQTAVAEFDHYALPPHQHAPETRHLPQEDPYGALIPQDQPHTQQLESYNANDSIFSSKEHGYLRDIASILDPPDLKAWRGRLFNVEETIVMSEEQFRTYFPHVDNVYSHRSTQRYKRKPLVSHYWDCRLKGRPPGTPKSDDPNKKKRKRTARERDLCDVKIKITEYFPGYAAGGGGIIGGGETGHIPISFSQGVGVGVETPLSAADGLPGVNVMLQYPASAGGGVDANECDNQPFGVLTPNPPLPEGHPGANGQRFFTIQRVNGNGANGKNDGVSGGHRHTLEESDRVKKNSVQRLLLKEARERKRSLSDNVDKHVRSKKLPYTSHRHRG